MGYAKYKCNARNDTKEEKKFYFPMLQFTAAYLWLTLWSAWKSWKWILTKMNRMKKWREEWSNKCIIFIYNLMYIVLYIIWYSTSTCYQFLSCRSITDWIFEHLNLMNIWIKVCKNIGNISICGNFHSVHIHYSFHFKLTSFVYTSHK